MIFKHCVLLIDLSVQLKRLSLEFFSSTPFEDEQLIQRFERSVEVKTFYLWSIWVSADFEQWRASAARVKNPRLCNPIKVTGFISPDLTFSAPEDFMTLPMPSFYYLAAIMNVMHNIFFFDDFSNREFH